MDARRANEGERSRAREMDDRRQDTRRDDRRDYYDDRRRYSRGVRYSASWWTSNSCSQEVVVVLDGYRYYQCNDAWFGRTYYGGEVTYTVIDAPEGY